MTLLDAPTFDAARARRHQIVAYSTFASLLILIMVYWFVAGRPLDWPWNWNAHLFGRATMNRFLNAVEHDNLPRAYGIWNHDRNWQQHPGEYANYTFERFQQDFSPDSSQNQYGVIRSHQIVAAHVYGNVLLVAILINGRKSGALNLEYDPKTDTLNFPPPDDEINPESYVQ